MFLCNYADSLTDCPIDAIVDHHRSTGATATILATRPTRSLHILEIEDDSTVDHIGPMKESGMWINGGYMVLQQGIFDVIEPGDELVDQPFKRLIAQRQLSAYRYCGNWMAIDTFKDRQELEDLWIQRQAPGGRRGGRPADDELTCSASSLPSGPLRLACLAAHSDDVEIGAGGTLLQAARRAPRVDGRLARPDLGPGARARGAAGDRGVLPRCAVR